MVKKFRRYRKKKVTLKKQVKKLAKRVAGIDKAEMALQNFALDHSAITNLTTLNSTNSLQNIQQIDITSINIGDEYVNRTGNEIHIDSIRVKGIVQPRNIYVRANYEPLKVKLMLLKIKTMPGGGVSGNSVYPTFEDVFNQNAAAPMLSHDFFNDMNPENNNVVVCWSKEFVLPRFDDDPTPSQSFLCNYRPPKSERVSYNNATGSTNGSYQYVNKNCYVFIATTNRVLGGADATIAYLTAKATIKFNP